MSGLIIAHYLRRDRYLKRHPSVRHRRVKTPPGDHPTRQPRNRERTQCARSSVLNSVDTPPGRTLWFQSTAPSARRGTDPLRNEKFESGLPPGESQKLDHRVKLSLAFCTIRMCGRTGRAARSSRPSELLASAIEPARALFSTPFAACSLAEPVRISTSSVRLIAAGGD